MPRIHLIGNAHLDHVWLWRWQEGFAEVKATFRSALDRLNEFVGFIFTCANACYYQWAEQNEPSMFEEIRQRVTEGRWVIAGGWWIQPDCNIPSGEAFVRHGLYSQRYFMRKFGKIASFGYNVDSFGHNAMLPQILAKSGMDYYVMRRPESHELKLPADVFWWQSPDGSRVLTSRLPYSYYANENREEIIQKYQDIKALSERQGTPMMYFYGVGNHGGGPTKLTLRILEELMVQEPGETVYSSPEQYFAEVRSNNRQLPVVTHELQHHAVGCYSAVSEIKANNRKAEGMLVSAEKAMTLASCVLNLSYDHAAVERAWQCVMFNQFHDIMGGCSIREAYDDARDFHGEALKTAAEIGNAALQTISWAIDTSGGKYAVPGKNMTWLLWEHESRGAPVVVFNSLSWDVDTAVQMNQHIESVEDENGCTLAIQTVRGSCTKEDDKWDTLFQSTIPALGYRIFWAYTQAAPKKAAEGTTLSATAVCIENEYLRIETDPETGCIRLLDKRVGTDLFEGWGAVPLVIEDVSDTWGHGVLEFRKEAGRFGSAKVSLIEAGPIRAMLRVVSHYGNSTLQQDFSLYQGSAQVEAAVKLNWQEAHRILKLSFPVRVQNPSATYEIPYGAINRPTDGAENPGQSWVDVSGVMPEGGAFGLALANNAKYSYDVLDTDLRMTVARSALYADHFGERDEFCEYMDQGIQYMKYILLPHSGTWQESGIVKRAEELLSPPTVILETFHTGVLPLKAHYVDISADNVVLTALKRAEDGEAIIVRCRETHGERCTARIRLEFCSRDWTARFGPYEIKTFLLRDGEAIMETDLLERRIQTVRK
jgi:alpha-mannosidase